MESALALELILLGLSAAAEYGRFFLSWYSGLLVRHADRVLAAANQVFTQRCRPRRVRERREVRAQHAAVPFCPCGWE